MPVLLLIIIKVSIFMLFNSEFKLINTQGLITRHKNDIRLFTLIDFNLYVITETRNLSKLIIKILTGYRASGITHTSRG